MSDVSPGVAHLVRDAESIDDAGDYVSFVGELVALAAGAISVESIECEDEDTGRRLVLVAGKRTWEATLDLSGYIDLESVLECLNRVATAQRAKQRFCSYRESD